MDLDPKPVPESTNPDRKNQYRDSSPAVLRDQLNENWRQLRILSAAVGDRDRIIASQHLSISERDTTIKLLNSRLSYSKIRVALLYALVGGAAAKGAEVGILALGHFLAKALLQ
jgi:cell division protein FtsL